MKKLFAIILTTGMITASSSAVIAYDDAVLEEFRKTERNFNEFNSRKTPQDAFPSNKSTVDDYINYSLLNNQELKSAFGHWSAAMERARQAGYYDEPVLTFEKTMDEVDLDYRIALTQPIPWYGKRSLKKKIGMSEAKAAMNSFMAVKSEVYMMVVKVFNEYLYLSRVTDVTAENLQLLSDLEKVIQARYESGKAEFSDLTKIQVESDKLKNDLATLRDEQLVRSSKLAALLDIDTEKLIPWPKQEARNSATLPEDVLFDLLRELNPELRAMDAIVERDEFVSKLAKKSSYPDFTVGAGWMVMPENSDGEQKTDTSLTLGIKLPLWRGKYASERKEAEAIRAASIASRGKLENDLKVELRMAIFKTKDALRRIKLFDESLIPKGEQALKVATNDYTTGKVGFMTLIDAQRTLLEFKVMSARAAADVEIALAEIGCCVGKYDSPGDLLKKTGKL